jgi:peroxiredoxin Q/BCP
MLNIGDRVPDFRLENGSGESVSLSDFWGKTVVVLFFYPKDNSRICTIEACGFRDNYELFKELGSEVIGISSDSSTSHAEFASSHRLPFILLSDTDGAVRKRFGISRTLGLLPGRATFIIDKKGIIRHVFLSQIRARKHVDEAIKIVQAIHKEPGTK